MKTKENQNRVSDTVSKEIRALNIFTKMMTEKLQTIDDSWEHELSKKLNGLRPVNCQGREYADINKLMLMMHCEKMNYQLPVFMTYNQCISLNFTDSPQGGVQATDAEGNKMPWVHVRKGEKSFPLFRTVLKVVAEDGKEIPFDQYKYLSDDGKKKYKVYPVTEVYDVFNIAQTNIAEARPDLVEQLKKAALAPSSEDARPVKTNRRKKAA